MATGPPNYRRISLMGLLLALLLSRSLAPAGESSWPHLRGPSYDGISIETDLADHWPRGGPLALWTIDVGQGYSGFCAHGGRVYTQTQTLYGQYLVCLDGDTGKEIW